MRSLLCWGEGVERPVGGRGPSFSGVEYIGEEEDIIGFGEEGCGSGPVWSMGVDVCVWKKKSGGGSEAESGERESGENGADGYGGGSEAERGERVERGSEAERGEREWRGAILVCLWIVWKEDRHQDRGGAVPWSDLQATRDQMGGL